MTNNREWIRVPYTRFIKSTDLFCDEISKNPYQDFNGQIISDNRFNKERIEKYYITILYVKNREVVIFCLSDRREQGSSTLLHNYKHSLHIRENVFPRDVEKNILKIFNGIIKMPYEYNEFIDKHPEVLPTQIRNNKMSGYEELAKAMDDDKYQKGLILFDNDPQKAAAFAFDLMPSDKVVEAIQSDVDSLVSKFITDNKIDGLDFLQAVKNHITPSKGIMRALKIMYPGGVSICKAGDKSEDTCEKWAAIGKYSRMPEVLRVIVKEADNQSDSDTNNITALATKIKASGSTDRNGKCIRSTDVVTAGTFLDNDGPNSEIIGSAIAEYEAGLKNTDKKKRGKIMNTALGVKGDSVVIRDKDED